MFRRNSSLFSTCVSSTIACLLVTVDHANRLTQGKDTMSPGLQTGEKMTIKLSGRQGLPIRGLRGSDGVTDSFVVVSVCVSCLFVC